MSIWSALILAISIFLAGTYIDNGLTNIAKAIVPRK